MTELYLIAHKVRGEATFDIGQHLECKVCQGIGGHDPRKNDYEGPPCHACEGEGFWWIIPTSGHRAYPFWSAPLKELVHLLHDGGNDDIEYRHIGLDFVEMPDNWPDHYSVNDQVLKRRKDLEINLDDIL